MATNASSLTNKQFCSCYGVPKAVTVRPTTTSEYSGKIFAICKIAKSSSYHHNYHTAFKCVLSPDCLGIRVLTLASHNDDHDYDQ